MNAVLAAAALATLMQGVQAWAQVPVPTADRQARVWAASCAACHGTGGRSAGASIPSLAGRGADELLELLLAFRAGQREGATVMHQHAKGYTADELRRIAQHFAAQPR